MIKTALPIIMLLFLASCQTIGLTAGVNYGRGAIGVSAYNDFLYPAPNQAYKLNKKGYEAFKARNYEEAVPYFRAVLKKYPNNPDAQFYLGLTEIGLGEREKGLKRLKAFRAPNSFRQQEEVRWWADYFMRHKDRMLSDIYNTMRRVRNEGYQQDRRNVWEPIDTLYDDRF